MQPWPYCPHHHHPHYIHVYITYPVLNKNQNHLHCICTQTLHLTHLQMLTVTQSTYCHELFVITGNIEPAMNPQSLAAVLSVVCSILGLLCGIGIGLGLMFSYMKWRRSRNETGPSPTQTSFPAPLYDDIVMTPIINKIEPLLQQNVVYRHVRT